VENLPKPGYVSLNVKKEDARRIGEYAKKNNLTIVSFFRILAQNLPDVDIQTLVKFLKNIPKVKLNFTIENEVLRHHLAYLYYYIGAMHSLLSSLFPSPFIDLKIFRVLKFWEDQEVPYTALQGVGVLDSSFSWDQTFQLLRELENAEEALKRILDKNWSDWMEIKPPLLPHSIQLPQSLLKPDMIVKPEVRETLRNEVKPYIEAIAKICHEAESMLYSISADHPQILELCSPPLKKFKKLFKV